VTATEKFGIPYFAIDEPPDGHFRPYNLLSVRPQRSDLYRLTVDLVRYFDWSAVAVIYDGSDGMFIVTSRTYLRPINSLYCHLGSQLRKIMKTLNLEVIVEGLI
jgi:hypothetical protein